MPRLPAPLRTLSWNASDINVAVHFRIGDMQPTKEEWHITVLNGTILPALAQGAAPGTRVVVHIFMRADLDYKLFKQFPQLARSVTPPDAPGPRGNGSAPSPAQLARTLDVDVRFHTADSMAPFPTFLHLTQADISVQSRSAFSEYAAHLSARPLSFAADGSRFGQRYQQCGIGVVCCRDSVPGTPAAGNFTEGPMCAYDARTRIYRMLQRRGLLRKGAMQELGRGRSGALPAGLVPESFGKASEASWPLIPGYGPGADKDPDPGAREHSQGDGG